MGLFKGRLAGLLLHIFNFTYFLAGLAVLILGIVALCSPTTIVNVMTYIPGVDNLSKVVDLTAQGSIYLGPSIYMITLGSVVILLSILGCTGVFVNKRGILVLVFGVSTLCVMLFNIALIVFTTVDPYFIEGTVKHHMMEALSKNFEPEIVLANGNVTIPTDNEAAAAWITMQFEESCCGVDSYEDYGTFSWNNSISVPGGGVYNNLRVPLSCCMMTVPGPVATNVDQFVNYARCLSLADSFTNRRGCSDYVMQQVTRYNFVHVCVAASFNALQAIIVSLSLYLWTRQVKGAKV